MNWLRDRHNPLKLQRYPPQQHTQEPPLERHLKIAVLTSACLLFIGVCALYIIKYATFKFQVQPALERHNETVAAWLPDFESDRIATAESMLSMPVLTEADADQALNKLIPWTTEVTGAPLTVPAAMLEKLSAPDWITLDKSNVDGIDFRWMTDNLSWSRWSVWNAEPVDSFFKQTERRTNQPPRPDYGQLIAWAKLRYLHGLHNNDLIAAQSEVRHLARLIETNEHPEANQAALAIIGLEQVVATSAQAAPAEFEPFSQDILHRASSMLAFYESAAHPATRDDLVRKILTFQQPHFGLCGVLANYTFIRSIEVFRPIPFRDTTKLLDKFAKTSTCRRDYGKYLLGGLAPTSGLADHPFLQRVAAKEFSYLLFKDTIGLIVDMSSVTDAGRFYREPKRGKG